jgi:hypothetical protein
MRLIAIEEHFQVSALRRLAQPSGFDRAMGVDDPMAKRLAKLDDVGAGGWQTWTRPVSISRFCRKQSD